MFVNAKIVGKCRQNIFVKIKNYHLFFRNFQKFYHNLSVPFEMQRDWISSVYNKLNVF